MSQAFQFGESTEIMRAIVARGHTVCIPDGGRMIVGYDKDSGKPVERGTLREYGPDQEVELPVEEVRRLRASGHLVDPAKIMKDDGSGSGEARVTEQRSSKDKDLGPSITRS